jgi:hypothetical protein
MTDTQALSRWINAEMTRIAALTPSGRLTTQRYIDAIGKMSTHDAIRLFALTLIAKIEVPDLDTIKGDPV